jgi:hypothetical protein
MPIGNRATVQRAAKKILLCHSEQSEESLFVFSLMLKSKRDSSLRSERRRIEFSATC